MGLHLGLSDQYDIKSMIPMRKMTQIQKILLKISVPFYIPKILIDILVKKNDKNILHDGKRELSGKKIVVSSENILFKDVKLAAKSLKVTINDLVTACVTSSFKTYFD